MEQYIKKSALLAKIENLLDKSTYLEEYDCAYRDGNNGALYALKGKLDTLEVKEVDLEKEINKYISDNFFGSETIGFFANRTKEEPNDQDIALCAKHFFELGLKVSNPTITAEQDNEWHESSVKPPFTLTMDGNRYSKPMLCYDKFGNYCIAQYARMQTGYCGWYDGYEEVNITHWKELKAVKKGE